jgi:AsmA protein
MAMSARVDADPGSEREGDGAAKGRRGRRARLVTAALLAFGLFALLGVGMLATLPYLLELPAVQAYVAQQASDTLGRPVRYQSLALSVLPLPAIRLRGLEVSDDPRFGSAPVMRITEGRLRVRLRPLLSGRIELTDLALAGVGVEVIQDAAGQLNVSALGVEPGPGVPARGSTAARSRGPLPLLLGRVSVSDGVVRFKRHGPRPMDLTFRDVTFTAAAAGRPDEFEFKGEGEAAPGGVRLSMMEGRLGPVGLRPLGEAPLRAVVEVRAADVAPLAALIASAPSLSGPLAATVTVAGPLSRLAASGGLHLEHVVIAETRRRCPHPARRQLDLRDVHIPLRYSADGMESARAQLHVAGGTVSARVDASPDAVPTVTVSDLSVRGVQLQPVLADYLCQGHAVTGPLDLTGEIRLRADEPLRTVSGSGRLRIGPGKVVGPEAIRAIAELFRLGGVALPPAELADLMSSRSPLAFDSITATYRIDEGLARTDDLLYTAPSFRVTGSGTYGMADGRLELFVTLHQGLNRIQALVTGNTPGRTRIVPTEVHLADPRDLRRFIDRLLR